MQKLKLFLIIGVFLFISLFLFSCNNNENNNEGYDGREFDISLNQDKSIIAKTVKVGSYYEMVIDGKGDAISFEAKGKVPWNTIAKKISKVTINEGINNIGSFYFNSLTLSTFFLPSTVAKIGANAFSDDVILYSFSSVEIDTNYQIYYYSQEKKVGYFAMIGDTPFIWKSYSFLFIGNSFTFRPNEADDPMVPKLFKNLASNLDIDVEVDWVVKSSYTLKKYADPSDEMGGIVEEKLTNNQYDFIILQEQSTTPINSYDAFNNAVGALVKRIHETQKDAQIYLYETWGSPTGIEGTKYETISEMELDLRNAYSNSAKSNEVNITYVGKAFTEVVEKEKDINIYASDNRHQNELGAYLSAATHLATMLNVDVTKATYYNSDANVCIKLLNIAYNVANGN